MTYKRLSSIPSLLFLFSLLFFHEYSHASKEHAHNSDFYEAIIERDSSRVLSLCPSTKTESLPSTSGEWFKVMEETLVSLAFNYEETRQKRTPASGTSSSGLEERLSSLLNFNLLYEHDNSRYYPAFSTKCIQWVFSGPCASRKQEQKRLFSLVYELARDTVTSQHLQTAAYFTLLSFIDSKEHVGTNLALVLSSLINAKRFDLTSILLEEYCTLNDHHKKLSDTSTLMKGFVENGCFAEFEKLLEKHISSLAKEENPSEEDMVNLLFAFREFWKNFEDAEKNTGLPFLCKFLLSHIEKSFPAFSDCCRIRIQHVLCRALHCQKHPDAISEFKKLASDPDLEIFFRLLDLSTGQHEFILQGFLDCLSEFKANDALKPYGALIGKAYNLSQIYLQLMNQSENKLENLSRSSLNCLSEIYYLYAIVLAMDEKKYEASIECIRKTFIPFIQKNKRKDPSWQEQKAKAVCLLCLVAFKTPDPLLAKKQLSYIFSLIGELERFDHPSAKEMLPFIKVVAGNLFIKSKDKREKDTGKEYLKHAFEMVSKKMNDGYTKGEAQPSMDSKLVFFLLNGLESTGMDQKAKELSRLLIEFTLKPQRKVERQPLTTDSSKISRRGKARQKIPHDRLVEKIKLQQLQAKEQQEALSRGKIVENSPSKERQAGPSTERRPDAKPLPIEIASSSEKEKEDQIVSVSPDAFPEAKSDSDSQKPKKEKIKTRKAPRAESSSSLDSNDSLSASETSAADTPTINLDKYLDLLKNETFLSIFQSNHKRGKITFHDYKSLLGNLGASLRGGKGSHTKATLPQDDFLGLVLTIPNHTEVKPYMLDNLRDILTDIGLTPEALEKHMSDKQNAVQKRSL